MIESYESPVAESADSAIDRIESRLQAIERRWDDVEDELCRLYPEVEADGRRGRINTPWQIKRQ